MRNRESLTFNDIPGNSRAVPSAGLFPLNRTHLLVLSCVTVFAYAVCLLIVLHYNDYWHSVRNSDDSLGYIAIARSLRAWDPHIVGHPVLFWGTGYAILAVSTVTGGDFETSWVAVSVICRLLSVLFSYRLFGIGVAAWFVFIDPAMMSRSMLGGSEPLFVALFLGALVALRKKLFYLAVLLAALGTNRQTFWGFPGHHYPDSGAQGEGLAPAWEKRRYYSLPRVIVLSSVNAPLW